MNSTSFVFLNITTDENAILPGGSRKKGYTDQIEAFAVLGGSGHLQSGPLIVRKHTDISSPLLEHAAVTGEVLPKIKVTKCSNAANLRIVKEWELENVKVAFQDHGDHEELRLEYKVVRWAVPDGNGGFVRKGFDLEERKSV